MGQITLLISDLDGTLLGDNGALADFLAWYDENRNRMRLVYSSGRFFNSVRQSIQEFHLPTTGAVICGVGTEIYDLPTGQRIDSWPETVVDWDSQLIRAVCAQYAELREQPRHLLSNFKVSYYGHDLDEGFLRRLTRQLEAHGQEVCLIYSSNRDLDVLPAATNKGTAATFLARHWGIARDQVIVAGDTGNDLEMFRAGFRGIVVGNAQPELLTLHGPKVYHARAHFAAGVLEGLQYWLTDLSPVGVTSDRSNWDPGADRGRHG